MNRSNDAARCLCIPLCDRRSDAEALYELMYTIRSFETSVLEMFDAGEVAGTTHTCLGQEATAAGILSAVDRRRDLIVSNHRNHGHFLAYCGEIELLYLEIMGKPGGMCAGRGGSQHLHFHRYYSNGVQGGIVPVACGMALAEKMKPSGAVAVVFLGDGTLGEGAVYESFNIASLWNLPVLFVIEDNGYAQSTPSRLGVSGSIRARAEAFNIRADELFERSLDAQALLGVASCSIDDVRERGRPRCLILHNARLGPHSKGDDTRERSEIRRAWERDPLSAFRAKLARDRAWEIEQRVTLLIHEAQAHAQEAPAYRHTGTLPYDYTVRTDRKNGNGALLA
ncbi:MAG: thiamine pyrophosphate-dependent dehydrogenase E1 component subunit alpha [Acidobacteriota bacterium]